jgi:hypothetical protein
MKVFFGFLLIAFGFISCNSSDKPNVVLTENENIEFSEIQDETSKEIKDAEIISASFTHKQLDSIFKIHWNKFRHSLYEDPDFDWYKHGAHSKEDYHSISSYFEDDYVQSVLVESDYSHLEKGEYKGKKTKTLTVAIASDGMMMGDVCHFSFEHGTIVFVGRKAL